MVDVEEFQLSDWQQVEAESPRVSRTGEDKSGREDVELAKDVEKGTESCPWDV